MDGKGAERGATGVWGVEAVAVGLWLRTTHVLCYFLVLHLVFGKAKLHRALRGQTRTRVMTSFHNLPASTKVSNYLPATLHSTLEARPISREETAS